VKALQLHDLNNPSQLVVIDADDFSTAAPMNTGSAVRLKSSDIPILVHESPEEILALMQ
jgi:hypothetical protein